jgi:hypothetical protein
MPSATQSIESGLSMDKMKSRGGSRLLRSIVGKALSLGACATLMVAGAVVIAASPAGAATTATQLAFTTQPPVSATVGVDLATFHVTIEGSDGNPATNDSTDNVTITSSAGCTLGGSGNSVLAVANVATFSGVTITAPGTCTLIANDTTTTGLTAGTSNSVTAYSTAATMLGFSVEPASTATAGAALTFTVQAQNGAGALAATGGQTDAVTITSTCTIAGTTTGTLVGGSYSFTAVTIDGGTSPCKLTATDNTTPSLTAAVSTGITVAAGTATKVLFTTQPPTTVTASAVLAAVKVSVTDVYGNVATTSTNATDTITLTPSTGCTLGGTTAAAAVAGVATFSALTVTSDGSCTLTATDSTHALTTATSTAVDSQGAQATLVVSSLTGYLGTPLVLATTGGSGTGAVTFTATVGTALGCVVTGTSLAVTSLGTCLVTATKAASLTNLAVSSVVTTVTFVVPLPKATHVDGVAVAGQTRTVIIIGSHFSGRPRITSHAGTTAVVTKDNGRLLTAKVKVKAGERAGTYTFTITFAGGKVTKVKYVQKA